MVEIKSEHLEDSVQSSPSVGVDNHEGSKYRLLYSKSKVYVNPTAYSRDNIPGFVALVKRVGSFSICLIAANASLQEAVNPSYLLAWLPETLLNEKGQTEWDKFVKIEERTTLDEEDGVCIHP